MKHIFIILVIASLFISCATQPDVVELTPEMEQHIEDPVGEEYDLIITMCRGMFEHYGTGITTFCILRNFYAMNNVDRMYIDQVVTGEEFRDCHKEEFYFPEYGTFWYGDVWDCLKGVINE